MRFSRVADRIVNCFKAAWWKVRDTVDCAESLRTIYERGKTILAVELLLLRNVDRYAGVLQTRSYQLTRLRRKFRPRLIMQQANEGSISDKAIIRSVTCESMKAKLPPTRQTCKSLDHSMRFLCLFMKHYRSRRIYFSSKFHPSREEMEDGGNETVRESIARMLEAQICYYGNDFANRSAIL